MANPRGVYLPLFLLLLLLCVSVHADELSDGIVAAGKSAGVSEQGTKIMLDILLAVRPPKGMKVPRQAIIDGLKTLKNTWQKRAKGKDKAKADAFMTAVGDFLIKAYS